MESYGIIHISIAPLYEEPTHRAEMGTQALMGTLVELLDETTDWYKVRTPDGYQAWCEKECLTLTNDRSGYEQKPKVVFTSRYGLAYFDEQLSIPATDLCAGCQLVLLETLPITFKAELPSGQVVYLLRQDAEAMGEWRASRLHTEQQIVNDSLRFLGTPYLWGGTSSVGVDCSGFTKMVYALSGIGLKRNASQQCLTGLAINVSTGYADLKPADLVFFASQSTGEGRGKITHVGIYLGDGDYIHASAMVRINSLDPASPKYHPRAERFVRASRILGMLGTEGIWPL